MQEKTAYTGIMYLTRARILSGEDRDKLVKVSWGGVKKLELRPEDCKLLVAAMTIQHTLATHGWPGSIHSHKVYDARLIA